MIYIIISLIFTIGILYFILHDNIFRTRIIYKDPENYVKYKSDVLNMLYEHQKKYAEEAEKLYGQLEFYKKNRYPINTDQYTNLLKEYTKFENMCILCKNLIEEINNINIDES